MLIIKNDGSYEMACSIVGTTKGYSDDNDDEVIIILCFKIITSSGISFLMKLERAIICDDHVQQSHYWDKDGYKMTNEEFKELFIRTFLNETIGYWYNGNLEKVSFDRGELELLFHKLVTSQLERLNNNLPVWFCENIRSLFIKNL